MSIARRKSHRPRSVLVAIFTSGITGWKKRIGVFRYIGEGRPWNVRMAVNLQELQAAWGNRGDLDGILVNAPGVDPTICGFADMAIPMVLFNHNLPSSSPVFSRRNGVFFLHQDSSSIGMTAAQHLLSIGIYRSFVFLAPEAPTSWSEQRERAFSSVLQKKGFSCTRLTASQGHLESSAILSSLPRPIGLFAASDRTALHAFAIARMAKLRIPDELSIIGVDNDESICESSTPLLSSIATEPETFGYTAARLLDQLMEHPDRPSKDVVLRCKLNVVTRRSTPEGSPHGHLVTKALAYISSHAIDGIGPNDVAQHLGISRRLLDLRFSQIQHGSVLAAIQEQRLARVKEHLLHSSMTIEQITQACGFGSLNHLKKLFKGRFGMSMRQWRQLHQRSP
ncbi:MAG: substrate-binding domain-containing protein [Kiritimatiellae bacterium]|nr:substrate-binding domain-containing protein [Kiritimatiellia bacterium]